jgi:hypothetical protein
VRPEWNLELSRGDMDQVEELLDIIEAQKMMGVTGASVMFSGSNNATDLVLSTQALKILLACAQRNYETKPHSSESSGCYWMWTPCLTCLSCFPREIRPNR